MQRYSEILRTLLEKRGIKNQEEAEAFLSPSYERDFHDPFLMRDMEKACVRIYEAMEAGEKIIIYADYDSDGIPGAVILSDLFKKVNYKNYKVYIPQRNSEGYGLNFSSVKQFVEEGVKLLITIDLGITAVAEVAQLEVDGIDVIITDHHLPIKSSPPEKFSRVLGLEPDQLENSLVASDFTLPRAYAILNPKVDDYPEKMLCGAGVVFKLVQAFVKKYGELYKINSGWEKWTLDMAGIA
ncbi:MAG: DHH family phosphoesterase, partial [Minisyncoccia bacterium]